MPVTERALELAMTAAQAAADKKAQDIVVIDVADQLYITDAFVIASASNERQVVAIVDAVEEALLNLPEKAKPVRREGERQGRWVLLDYIDVVIHIQHAEEREFYALDKLWKDCPTIPFVDRDMVDADASARVRRRVSRLIVWRHGNTDWNASHRVQGQTDVPLNELGRQQAVDAAELLVKLPPDAIVASDLRRAADTAAALAALTGLPVTHDKRLRERYFGAWQGLTMTEVAETRPDEYARWTAGADVIGGDIETLDDLGKRVAEALQAAAELAAARRHGRGGHPRRGRPAGHRAPARLAAGAVAHAAGAAELPLGGADPRRRARAGRWRRTTSASFTDRPVPPPV